MDEVKVIQVIYCAKKRAGDGNSYNDPIRIVREIFDLDGSLTMDSDPERVFTTKDMVDFAIRASNGSLCEAAVIKELNEYKERCWNG